MRPTRHKTHPCDGEKASCLCKLKKGHRGIHRCTCGGSWKKNGEVVTFPSGESDPVAAFDTMFGLGFGLSSWDDDE